MRFDMKILGEYSPLLTAVQLSLCDGHGLLPCIYWCHPQVILYPVINTISGVTLSSVMPSLQTLFVSLGMLTGAGIGLATTPGIILTARYFDDDDNDDNDHPHRQVL